MQNESIVSDLSQWLDRQDRLFDFNCCHNDVSTEVLMQLLTIIHDRLFDCIARIFLIGCYWETDEVLQLLCKIVAEGKKME